MLNTKAHLVEVNTHANIKKATKVKKLPVNTRRLSYFFAILFIILSGVLFYPFSKFFSGDWLAWQGITLVPEFRVDFLAQPLGPIELRFYSLFMIIGILGGYILTNILSKRHFIPDTMIDRLFIGMVIFGLLGARVFYVIFSLDRFENDFLKIISINEGGIAIFGALIAGFVYLVIHAARFKFNLYELLDFIVPGVLLGQIFGRFGNFFNYEAFGPATSVFWKMYVPSTASSSIDPTLNEFYHPTFLYEIIPNAILLVLILYYYQNLTYKKAGLVFGIYALGYGIIRFFTEFFRFDALKIDFFLSLESFTISEILVSQVSALLLLVIGILTVIKRRKVFYLSRQMQEFDNN